MHGASRVQSPVSSVDSLWRCFPWGRVEVARGTGQVKFIISEQHAYIYIDRSPEIVVMMVVA
jgi:hypothetical protein